MAKALNASELNTLILNKIASKVDVKVFNGVAGVSPLDKNHFDLSCYFEGGHFRLIESSNGDSNFTIYDLEGYTKQGRYCKFESYAKLKAGLRKSFVEFLKSKEFEIRVYVNSEGNYNFYELFEVGVTNDKLFCEKNLTRIKTIPLNEIV